MNLGAFLVVTLVHYHEGSFDLRDYPGLYRRAPLLDLAMAVFLLSLMGIPPLVGFMAKLYVFAAVDGAAARSTGGTRWSGAVNAAIAAYYYARVLKTMIIDAGNEEQARRCALALADAPSLCLRRRQPPAHLLAGAASRPGPAQSLVLYAGR